MSKADSGIGRRESKAEWLEADGLGGFAMGCADGLRRRRYHGLLNVATQPPTGRVMLVAAVEAWVDFGDGGRALSSHRYEPDVVHPDGRSTLVAFGREPFPTWIHRIEGTLEVASLVAVPRGYPAVVLRWRTNRLVPGARLFVRPLLAGRDLHALWRQSHELRIEAKPVAEGVRWTFSGDGVERPSILAFASGAFHAEASTPEPLWYRGFTHEEEQARGFDHLEDLASPGMFELDLSRGEAALVLVAEAPSLPVLARNGRSTLQLSSDLLAAEDSRRRALEDPLERAAEDYFVQRGSGLSLIAGYPWFTDWGRDTFIALRGLALARGRPREAGDVLGAWAEHVSDGLLPNRFVDGDEKAEYHSVDASLWFVVVVGEYLDAMEGLGKPIPTEMRARLGAAVQEILTGYREGTRFGIRLADDGLLAAGEPGLQLTWMDAKAGDRVVTPRIGKPVEIQALWAAALRVGERFVPSWAECRERLERVFEERFWDEERGALYDVVDVDHVAGQVDRSLRPNQILAVGGLPHSLLHGARARRLVDAVEERLWTPLGLRTLDPADPRYVGRYEGGPEERDGAYHQGTAWPWLLGPFVEAWVRVRGATREVRAQARERFLLPMRSSLGHAGLGHVSEIVDGDAPHLPRGAPFQAWSLGELLRLERVVLAGGGRSAAKAEAYSALSTSG